MLKKTFFIISVFICLFFSSQIQAIDTSNNQQEVKSNIQSQYTATANDDMYTEITPLDLVNQPKKYLNKKIKMQATFDKFSAIGLDYPPVKRDAKTYISFMVKRDNVTEYNIPLSELKLMLKRDYAEKALVKVENGDKIKIYGTVFSTALGDPWVDVEKVLILTPKKDKTDKDTDNEK